MADINTGINAAIKNTGPFGMEPAETQLGAFGQGLLTIPSFLYDANKTIGDAMVAAPGQIIDYLGSPTEYGKTIIAAEAADEKKAAKLARIAELQNKIEDNPNFLGEFGDFGGYDIATEMALPPVDMSGLDIEYQVDEAAKQKKKDEAAEEFRALENQEQSRGFSDSTAATQEQTDAGFMAAMDDFFESARGAGPEVPEKRTIEQYKKAFSEATGIDTSGKVDKKDALMAFGLALMQNKAGKGFNVGKMLTATGAAGQAAMPALQKARERTRLDGIAAGKYALESQSADEAKALAAREKAMERTDYFVVPKSDNVRGLLANLAKGEGKRKSLSKYELDKLMKNPEFAAQFEVLPGSVWGSVVSEAMKTPEAQEYFNTTPQPMSLITGDDDPLYTIDVFYADPNKGKRGQVQPSNLKAVDSAYRALQKRFKTNQTNKEKFIDLQKMSDEGAVNVFSTLIDVVDSAASAFGVNVSEGANPNEKMKALLTELQAKQASNILGEGGKNTSDFERQLVKSIVGDKTLLSNPDLIEFKLAKLYNDVVVGEENKILEGLTNLDAVSGKQISGYFGDGDLTEKERKSMNADLKAMGVDQ